MYGTGEIGAAALFFLFARDDLDHRQDQRQPGGRGDDHREGHADEVETGEGVDDRRQGRGRVAQPQDAGEDVHAQRGQPQLQPGEDAVGAPERQGVEDDAERVERGVLSGRQERHAGKVARVPKDVGQAARTQRLDDQRLPRPVLQDQVADQQIVRYAHTLFGGKAFPGFGGKEIIGREEGLAA